MKKLILLAFVLLPVLLSGQVLKGTGISYFDSIPNVAPSLPKGTEIALGIKTKKLYRWDRTCSCWIELETSTDSLARTVLASGLFNEYAVPFGGSTGKLDQSAAFKFILGQLQANSFATLGSAGAGYVGLSPQSSVPATPASGIRVYADASGRFGWIGTNGYTRVFDASGITANRIFKLQNKTYTLADSVDVASLSASLPSAYFPLPGGTLTGTGGAGFVGFPAQSSAPSAPGAGFRVFANGAGNMGVIRADGYVTTFDFSTATGNRFFTYPANAGTFGILENSQTWSGSNIFNGDANKVNGIFTAERASVSGFDVIENTSGKRWRFGISNNNGSDKTFALSRLFGGNGEMWQVYENGNTVIQNAAGTYNAVVASAVLNVSSSSKGLLIPKMSTALRDAILSPVSGLRIFNTSTSIDNYHNGSVWGEYHGSLNAIVNTNNNHRLGFLQILTSGLASTTGQGIVITGLDSPFNLQGSPTSLPNTFLFDTYTGGQRSMINTNTVNAFVGIKGGFINPNTNNVSGASLYINPTINVSTFTGATIRGIYYNPTLTSTTGVGTHNAIETESGNVVFKTGTLTVNSNAGGGADIIKAQFQGTSIFRTTENGNTYFNNWIAHSGSNAKIYSGQTLGIEVVFANNPATATGSTMNHFSILGTWHLQTLGTGNALTIAPTYDFNTNRGVNGVMRGIYYNPTLINLRGSINRAFESTSGDVVINGGKLAIGTSTPNASALVELSSTIAGFLPPRANDTQIGAISSPALGLQAFSTTSERINVKRTDGFYQVAYVQDIKRDTVHKTVNANLDLSGLTSTWKTRNKRVTIEAILTAAATGNIDITLPAPTADLVGIRFDVSVEDTSGDSDISVLQFGTDGVDGNLYNGDGTFATSQNLYPGLGVYLGVYWCEVKSAYRWKLQ